MINLEKSDTWKIQLTTAINFISSKDIDKERVMHSKSESLLSRYQIGSEILMRGSDFIFDSVQLLYYKFHNISFKRGGSYIDSPDWIKKKKGIINPKNEDSKCFQYAATVASNHEEIKRDLQRISKIKAFLNKYNWNGMNNP